MILLAASYTYLSASYTASGKLFQFTLRKVGEFISEFTANAKPIHLSNSERDSGNSWESVLLV